MFFTACKARFFPTKADVDVLFEENEEEEIEKVVSNPLIFTKKKKATRRKKSRVEVIFRTRRN